MYVIDQSFSFGCSLACVNKFWTQNTVCIFLDNHTKRDKLLSFTKTVFLLKVTIFAGYYNVEQHFYVFCSVSWSTAWTHSVVQVVHFIRTNSMPIWFLFRFERQKNRSEKTSFHITCCLDNENVTIDIVSQPFHILACNYSTCDYPAKYVKSTLNHIFNADSMNQSFDNQFFWHRIGCWIEN